MLRNLLPTLKSALYQADTGIPCLAFIAAGRSRCQGTHHESRWGQLGIFCQLALQYTAQVELGPRRTIQSYAWPHSPPSRLCLLTLIHVSAQLHIEILAIGWSKRIGSNWNDITRLWPHLLRSASSHAGEVSRRTSCWSSTWRKARSLFASI